MCTCLTWPQHMGLKCECLCASMKTLVTHKRNSTFRDAPIWSVLADTDNRDQSAFCETSNVYCGKPLSFWNGCKCSEQSFLYCNLLTNLGLLRTTGIKKWYMPTAQLLFFKLTLKNLQKPWFVQDLLKIKSRTFKEYIEGNTMSKILYIL